jgi:hypothetical protein
MNRLVSIPVHSLILILCFGVNYNSRAAESSSLIMEVEIDAFSGRPNPVFNLQTAEVTELNQFLWKAKGEEAIKDTKADIIPSILGYRGLHVRERDKNKAVISEIQIFGKDILIRGSRGEYRRLKMPDDSLEKYLVDLALAKGAIDKDIHQYLRQEMQKR